MAPAAPSGLRATARNELGLEDLRPGQAEAAEAILAGRDALAVLPTGYGKSAIYQLVGRLLPGPTLVVSPLVALQRDQASGIEELGIGGAETVDSTRGERAREAALAHVREGEVEFLLTSPEQLTREDVVAELVAAAPSLVVVDEAHCISTWGHDFRPAFLRLGGVVDALGHPRVLALTATASPPVRDEIVARLRLRDPAVIVGGFERENLWLGVERVVDDEDRARTIVARIAGRDGSGLVYAATRARTEALADRLVQSGIEAAAYHAGLGARRRRELGRRFMDDHLPVVVATSAFGMGIDKPDVRFVIHADVTGSVAAYYQEIGRAGRDGDPALGLLTYRPEDLALRRFFAGRARLDEPLLHRVLRELGDARGRAPAAEELHRRTGGSRKAVRAALDALVEAELATIAPDGGVRLVQEAAGNGTSAALEARDRHRRREESEVAVMRGYAEAAACRWSYLLAYLGERLAEPCGHCDVCEEAAAAGRRAAVSHPEGGAFHPGERVTHPRWGPGSVIRADDETVSVLFDRVGYRDLDVELVQAEHLLRPSQAPPPGGSDPAPAGPG